jgi:hypothetical protein
VMKRGTLLRANVDKNDPTRRKNFFMAAGVTQYQLPAPPGPPRDSSRRACACDACVPSRPSCLPPLSSPAGHWLPNAYCEILREPCGTGDDEPSEACRQYAHRDSNSHSPGPRAHACCFAQPARAGSLPLAAGTARSSVRRRRCS